MAVAASHLGGAPVAVIDLSQFLTDVLPVDFAAVGSSGGLGFELFVSEFLLATVFDVDPADVTAEDLGPVFGGLLGPGDGVAGVVVGADNGVLK